MRHGTTIGQPLSRREGRLKVTGTARYSADHHPDGLLHAVLAAASIARGRVASIETSAAEAHPGVVKVLTPQNAPKLAKSPDEKSNGFAFRFEALQDDKVRYAQQPIAVVIAETLEAATEGVALLQVHYETEPARVGLDALEPFTPPAVGPGAPADEGKGNVDEGLKAADQAVDLTFDMAAQYHNALEPHAILAQWTGEKLRLHMPSQAMSMAQARIGELFGISPANIEIFSPFLGGGFGSKAIVMGPHVLAIMAARETGRPVKLVLRREHMFGPVGHRGATRQRLRLGAKSDGSLTAISQHTRAVSSSFDDFYEPAGLVARHLYASPAIETPHEGVRADIGTPVFMRAPGEAAGSVTLESAMDELAYRVGLDPLEFRLKNYADVEPISGKPFSSKALRECYQKGAEAFGWSNRPIEPRRMRDADGLLVGWGVGTATFPAYMMQAEARAVLRADGTGRVEVGAHDMGQGAWTSLAQIAADGLGIAYDKLDIEIGHSVLPSGGITGGSAGTATAGSAIHAAAGEVIRQLADLATRDERSPLFGAGNAGVVARDGALWRRDDETRGEPITAILQRAGRNEIEAKGKAGANPAVQQTYALHAHGAVFAEVKVDPDLCQMRVTRLVGAFAAGRVINPRLVRSQYYGGMIWGLSLVLHEHAEFDPRSGRPMNPNLAEYHVPVNADVPSIEAILVDEHDPHVNELGIKGVGEIGITGTAGAIANAVWHATGVRVTDIPILLDKLIG
jgi:xanthine dehydrogenase YagR molybdenum-binding subunit